MTSPVSDRVLLALWWSTARCTVKTGRVPICRRCGVADGILDPPELLTPHAPDDHRIIVNDPRWAEAPHEPLGQDPLRAHDRPRQPDRRVGWAREVTGPRRPLDLPRIDAMPSKKRGPLVSRDVHRTGMAPRAEIVRRGLRCFHPRGLAIGSVLGRRQKRQRRDQMPRQRRREPQRHGEPGPRREPPAPPVLDAREPDSPPAANRR